MRPEPLDYVVIVGLGQSSWNLMEKIFAHGQFWKHRGGELWGISTAGYAFRCDKVWSIHDRAYTEVIFKEYDEKSPEHPLGFAPGWMRDLPEVPIVVGEEVPLIPNQLVYPIREVVKHFRQTSFPCTISYMLAWALMCMEKSTSEKKEIWLYGTEFNYFGRDENVEQKRHNVQQWIGRAKERGITVNLPAGSCLEEEEGLYGYTGKYEINEDFDLRLLNGN